MGQKTSVPVSCVCKCWWRLEKPSILASAGRERVWTISPRALDICSRTYLVLQEAMGRTPCPGLQLLFSAQDLSKPLKENYCKPGPPQISPFSDCNSQLTQAGGLDCKIRKDLGQFSGCFLALSSCVFTAVTGPTSFLETVG